MQLAYRTLLDRKPFWLRVAGFFLVVGLWGATIFFNYRVHFLHGGHEMGLLLTVPSCFDWAWNKRGQKF